MFVFLVLFFVNVGTVKLDAIIILDKAIFLPSHLFSSNSKNLAMARKREEEKRSWGNINRLF